MVYSEFVDMKHVEEYLDNEIKEISQRWAGFMINKMAIEKVREKKCPTLEEIEMSNEVKKALSEKKSTDHDRVMAKFPEEAKQSFEKVGTYEKMMSAYDQAVAGLTEFEEFLEMATELKGLISNKK